MRMVIGVLIGGALGYAYYRVVGCSTGACPITSTWWTSVSYGALLGGMVTGGQG